MRSKCFRSHWTKGDRVVLIDCSFSQGILSANVAWFGRISQETMPVSDENGNKLEIVIPKDKFNQPSPTISLSIDLETI